MANHRSALKRIRTAEKRRQRNRIVRGSARTAVKKARLAISSGKPMESELALKEAISALDKAAEKGVIHKNNAARRKSRLMRMHNQSNAVS